MWSKHLFKCLLGAKKKGDIPEVHLHQDKDQKSTWSVALFLSEKGKFITDDTRTEIWWDFFFFCFCLGVKFDHMISAIIFIIKRWNSRCGIRIGLRPCSWVCLLGEPAEITEGIVNLTDKRLRQYYSTHGGRQVLEY